MDALNPSMTHEINEIISLLGGLVAELLRIIRICTGIRISIINFFEVY